LTLVCCPRYPVYQDQVKIKIGGASVLMLSICMEVS
jgi:hypothetical protein